jgi:hypothetical protein
MYGMSEVILYQSVLQKLGQLSPQNLAELDAFLAFLVQKQTKGFLGNDEAVQTLPDQLFGAWKEWDEQEFQSFLEYTNEVRADLYGNRELDI